MIIDIPSAAIEPFEPHGLPRLHASNDLAKLALRQLLDGLNNDSSKNSKLVIGGLHIAIEKCLQTTGADFVSVKIKGPITKYEIPFCNVTVFYKMPGDKRLRGVFSPVWSEGGFA